MSYINKNNGFSENKQEVVSITYEEIGLFPRSFSRVLDRFLKQIFSDVENLVIQEYRFYRYLFLTTLKCLLILFFVPFFVNFLAKTYVVRPLTEYFWNTKQSEIFLNSYQQKRAFSELKEFEEKTYFESLIFPKSALTPSLNMLLPLPNYDNFDSLSAKQLNNLEEKQENRIQNTVRDNFTKNESDFFIKEKLQQKNELSINPLLLEEGKDLQEKTKEVVEEKFFPNPFNQDDIKEKIERSEFTNSTHSEAVCGVLQNLTKSNFAELANARIIFMHEYNSCISDKKEPLFLTTLIEQKDNNERTKSGLLYKPDNENQTEHFVSASNEMQKVDEYKQTDLLINSYTMKSSLFLYQTQEASKNMQQRYQEKTIELAQRYNDQSIEAITNFFADLISLFTLFYLLYALEIQINITKSFLLEVFFGLDDSKKSLLILLITDLLVGYHSSNLWELFFEFLFHHYGLPESQTGIFLLVATLPVLLDVLFKYLIFRHLNRSSPATVATYRAMIE